jgi:methionyl-tRNA formyltransferase
MTRKPGEEECVSDVRIAIYSAGEKGRAFVAAMLQERIARVVVVRTYAQSGTLDEAEHELAELCRDHAIPLEIGRRHGPVPTEVDLIFVVGWQFLLPADSRLVVFHDSLLPRYRGFSPTVTALIAGDSEIGVTALRPIETPDAGPILAQRSQLVHYPARIREVLDQLATAYLDCARDVVRAYATDALVEIPQDEAVATYSIWRDDADYVIDWSEAAERICRTVDALGWPYPGARTFIESTPLVVLEAIPGPALTFEKVDPGKIWSLSDNRPTVVCGEGTVILTDVRNADGTRYEFDRLRARLG